MDNGLRQGLFHETCHRHAWPATYEICDGNERVTFSNPDQMAMQSKSEMRVLKRGLPTVLEKEIPAGEKDSVQHLCFVVHGIGPACDMKFRSLVECVEDFRQTSRTILSSHFGSHLNNGDVHRVVSRDWFIDDGVIVI